MSSVALSPVQPRPLDSPAPSPPLTTWQKVKNIFWYVIDSFKACYYGRDPIFYEACGKGHIYTVMHWANRVDINKSFQGKDFGKRTPLVKAAENDQRVIAEFLIQHGANAKQAFSLVFPYKGWELLLDYALRSSTIQEIDAYYQIEKGFSVMELAASCGSIDLIAKLAEKGLSFNIAFIRLLNGRGVVEAIKELIQLYEKIPGKSLRELRIWQHQPLLCAAVRTKNTDVVEYLLSREDVEVDAADANGKTPLMYACEGSEEFPILSKLLEHGANVNVQNASGETALMVACENGRIDCVSQLLQLAGEIDVNLADKKGQTALMHLCRNYARRAEDAIDALVKKGADTRAKDSEGKTALMHLVSQDNYNIPSKELIQLLAPAVTEKDIHGKTAVHYAIENSSYSLFFPYLDRFDPETRESFVLATLDSDPFGAGAYIFRGCGVVDGKFSPAVQQAIDAIENDFLDPTYKERLKQKLTDALEQFNASSQQQSPQPDGDLP